MTETATEVTLRRLVSAAAVALVRPPFRTLLAVEILIAAVAATIPATATDPAAIIGGFVLLVVSAYLQIAILLAAASPEPGRSADAWITGAFRKRCFWRFALTLLLVRLMVVIGLAVVLLAGSQLRLFWLAVIGLIVVLIWGFLIGSVVGIAEQAAVLERRWPLDAAARSGELSRAARRPIGIIFALLVVAPSFLGDRFIEVDLYHSLGPFRLVPSLIAVAASMAGLIALTRGYVELGGTDNPAPRRRR